MQRSSKFDPPPIANVRNIKPQGRSSGHSTTHVPLKDKLEKERLKSRTFGHIRYNGDVIDDPINQQQDSLCFANDIDRFQQNFDQFETEQRNSTRQKQDSKINKLKNDRENREQMRWKSMDAERESKAAQIKQFVPIKNNPSMPYNPITLRYDDSLDGQRLQLADEKIIWRAKLREKMLFEKQTCGYDPISGCLKKYEKPIDRPETPIAIKHTQ